jgi:hypothetical protein
MKRTGLLGGWSSPRKLESFRFPENIVRSQKLPDKNIINSLSCILRDVEQDEPAQATTAKMRTMIIGSAIRRAASTSFTTARLFSTSSARESTWGFIGLGAMGKAGKHLMFSTKDIDFLPGYPMAKNLRAKIPETDTLIICDTNPKAMEKFVEEVGIATSSTNAPGKRTGIHIAENPREVARKSVGLSHPSNLLAASS